MPRARKTDPYTSHDAARSVKNFTEVQTVIYELLNTPMTDEDLVPQYEQLMNFGTAPLASPSTIRTARHHLVDKGFIIDVGEGQSRFGRKALIWGRRR
jgi:hypothetical protein